MGMNETPSSERIHIGIFGRRNAGKSSVINAVTGQSLAIVSDIKGTTTDPVLKAMELLPLGPVVMVDTPGLDDEGELGKKRIEKSYQVLNKTDIAVLVIDAKSCLDAGAEENLSSVEKPLIECFVDKKIPYVIAVNKSEDLTEKEKDIVRRGRNANNHHLPKNANPADYMYATAFEGLIGYLYLTKNFKRLKEILQKSL